MKFSDRPFLDSSNLEDPVPTMTNREFIAALGFVSIDVNYPKGREHASLAFEEADEFLKELEHQRTQVTKKPNEKNN